MAINVGGDVLKKLLITHLEETEGDQAETPESIPPEANGSTMATGTFFSTLSMLISPYSLSTHLLLAEEEEQEEENPYLAADGLSTLDLVDYLLDMQEKPRSIRRRPGFAEAVSEAADRVLDAQTSDRYHVIAVEAKVQVLHEMASLGNKNADAMLVTLVEKLKDDERPQIASLVLFLQMEQVLK